MHRSSSNAGIVFYQPAGRSWLVDKTDIEVRGQWTNLYRTVNKCEKAIDFRLSRTRDVFAAKAFFMKAIRHFRPQTMTEAEHQGVVARSG
jgi:transposase-like protein